MSRGEAGGSRAQWEYRIESFADLGGRGEQERRRIITGRLNEWGRAGWELVSVASGPASAAEFHYTLVFKRPLPGPAATDP